MGQREGSAFKLLTLRNEQCLSVYDGKHRKGPSSWSPPSDSSSSAGTPAPGRQWKHARPGPQPAPPWCTLKQVS